MNYLNDMCEDFEIKMTRMIEKSLKKKDSKHFGINEKMYIEILQHLHFANHKSRVFCGRAGLLETVRQKMMATHTVTDVEGQSKENREKDTDEMDTSSVVSLYQSLDGQISKKDLDELKQIQAEHQGIKERLKQLGIIYNHADLDLDHENDPSRNPKAEMIRLPAMKTYCRPVTIYGSSGSGKTSVMAKIAELSKTWFPNSVQIVRFLGTSANSSSIRDVLLGICLQIWVLYKVKPPLNLDLESDFHFLTQYMLALLWRIKTKDRPLVILLDSVDQLQLTDHASTMHWLPLKVPPGVHIVVSAIPQHNNCLENLRSLLPSHDCMIHVPSLSQETSENMIKNALKEKSRRLTKLQWRHLLDKTAKVGQPLYVKLLADRAVTWKSSTAMSKTAVGNSIKEAIVRLFESIEKEHGEIIITHLYGYLSAARDGLSLSELEDILSLDDEVLQDTFLYHLPPDPENIRFPSAVLTRALFSVLDYLVERRSGMTSVLSWYHRQFTEMATERYLSKDRAVKIHVLLADYFQGVWYKKRKALKLYKKKTASYPNAVRSVPEQPTLYCHNMYNTRKLIELPYHLIKCQRYQVFRDIIACNFNFLYAKCKTLGVAEVIEDLRLCLVAMDTEGFLDEEIYNDIKFVHKVLLMGVNIIRKDTNNLPIQLMARLGRTVKTKWLHSLVKGAQEWCDTTSTPLLAPRSFCMPPPGGVLRVTIDIEIYLTENSMSRDLGHVMYLQEDVNHLFVLTPPTSRFDNTFIHMFDLADNGSRVFMTKLTRNFMAVNFLAGNKYIHVKDTRGYDQVFQSKSATPMELQHEAHCITASSSGKYLVYSNMSKVYVCLTDTRGGVNKIKHVLDTDQREKDVINSDQDKDNEGSENQFLSKKKTYEVFNLIISPDEKFLAVFNNINGYYKVWNLEKGEFLFDAKQPDTEEMDKFSFSFSEYDDIGNASIITNGNILIYRKDGYRFEGQLCMFDLETGKFLHTLDSGSSYRLTLLSLHPTHCYVSAATSTTSCSSGEHGKAWKIWDVSSGDMVTKATIPELFNDSWGMHCLKLFGSDKIFAVSSHHGTNGAIHISYCGSVDAPNSSVIPFCRLNSHTMDVLQVLVSSDMKQLISASKDNCVKTWDLNKVMAKFNTTTEGCCDDTEIASKLIPMFEEELKQTLTTNAIGVSSDAREIYLALSSGEMVIKDLKSNQVKSRVTMTSVPLSLLLVGSAGDLVVAASKKGNIEVWDIQTKVIHKSVKCKHDVSCMAEASDILVAGQAGMEAKGSIWNIRTGDLLTELSLLYSFYSVAINTSGTKFVSSMFDFPVVVSMKENTECGMMDMSQVDTDMSAAKCTAISPDESLALCGSIDGSIRVIEMTGAYKFRLGQKSTVITAVFSPDSQSIVSGGYKSIYIWNMLDGSLKFKVRKHDNFVLNIKFYQRGTHFLTTGRDKRIVIWDFRRGISLTTFYTESQVDLVEFTRRGYVVFVPEGVSSAATLKPNPVLKQMLKGKYNLNIGATITNAQGMALGFSSQKIQANNESARTAPSHQAVELARTACMKVNKFRHMR
ncbi:NACHT and WD repeat domain-containing protein 1 [Mizuhopecten yessoensis]|uniref:NACHT and WD repeat domain-containing protein 1 n=1 Tax=Mizuhopecten yessoensis TaxID=6573 RepID=A0A210Q2F2_MIZYE|nr:NACHT and WD repeat domain-containing protein 1 [Mizuhopecten yessoensis]